MITVRPCPPNEISAWRDILQKESGGICVHHSLPRRPGWTVCYALECDQQPAGYGAIAVGGPWQERPTVFEFYLAAPFRHRAFAVFEHFLAVSGARHFEVQSSHTLLAAMLHTFGREIVRDKIIFEDTAVTTLLANGATLRALTSDAEISTYLADRAGHADWALVLDGEEIGYGELYFHYNAPYCDLAMRIAEPHRRRGRGSYLVQELKRLARSLGAVPAARCDVSNIASQGALRRAGLTPRGYMLLAEVANSP